MIMRINCRIAASDHFPERKMRSRILVLTAIIAICIAPFLGADQSVGPSLEEWVSENMRVGKQYLVLIAIDKYKEWIPLKNPVKDAREIRSILTSRYYIDEVFELYNKEATKANILKLFNSLQKKLTIHDSLLIFYAGHGHLDNMTNTGFWIPVNAGLDKFEQSNWLPNTQIRGIISNFESMHICLIADSCFSGDILNITREITPAIDNEYFKKAYGRISRQVLTSGASESVPDISPFAYQLKMSLKKNQSPYVDPLMLFNDIRLGVETTTPLFGSLKETGHQEGASFLLFARPPKKSGNKLGSIRVESKTKGELYIDNIFKEIVVEGATSFDEIEVGEHNVKIVYDDDRVEERMVTVTADSIETVQFVWVHGKLERDDIKGITNPNYLSTGIRYGISIPVFKTSDILGTGHFPTGYVYYNFGFRGGFVGLGLKTGLNLDTTKTGSLDYLYDLYSFPFSIGIKYTTDFERPFNLFLETDGGVSLTYILFKENYIGVPYKQTVKPFFMPSMGIEASFFESLVVSMYGGFPIILFDNNSFTGIAPGLGLEYRFR